MNNTEIRNRVKETGVRMWQIAEALQIQDSAFSRKLRHELLPQEREKILAIIEDLAKEGS